MNKTIRQEKLSIPKAVQNHQKNIVSNTLENGLHDDKNLNMKHQLTNPALEMNNHRTYALEEEL